MIPLADIPLAAWWSDSQRVTTWLATDGLRILLTIALAVVARWLVHRVIDRFVAVTTTRHHQQHLGWASSLMRDSAGSSDERQRARIATVGSLLKSLATFVIDAVALLTIMSLLGIPLGPLLASAGIGGIAVAFGAQSLVKDFFSGVFMVVEDQFGVGDVIDTGQGTGTVEAVTLRVTKLRDAEGVSWYVRNGEILRIGNHSQGRMMAMVDIPVAYTEDLDAVFEVITRTVNGLPADSDWTDKVLDSPSILGVESVSSAGMTIRIAAPVSAGNQWTVQRELRRRIKSALDSAGIAGPPIFPPPTP